MVVLGADGYDHLTDIHPGNRALGLAKRSTHACLEPGEKNTLIKGKYISETKEKKRKKLWSIFFGRYLCFTCQLQRRTTSC